jgi:hypothetical protein
LRDDVVEEVAHGVPFPPGAELYGRYVAIAIFSILFNLLKSMCSSWPWWYEIIDV